MDDKKKLNKFEYMLLTLHLAVQDLPLEAEQLKHLIPLIDSLKKAHSEALSQRELEALTEVHAEWSTNQTHGDGNKSFTKIIADRVKALQAQTGDSDG